MLQRLGDFPGGPVVKNLPSNAGDAGLIPVWGTRIPHAVGQLSLHAATKIPCAATKIPRAATKTRHGQMNK